MFERFTERARQVIVLAQEEARNKQNDEITSGHLLYGLAAEEGGLAAEVLKELGITADKISDEISPGDHEGTGQLPFTPIAKDILEGTLREALSLAQTYVGTEHILLSLCEVISKVGPTDPREIFKKEIDSVHWKEVIKLEVLELLRGKGQVHSETEANGDEAKLKGDILELRDVVADFLTGFNLWRESKSSEMEWTDYDESFARWVEGSRANEYL